VLPAMKAGVAIGIYGEFLFAHISLGLLPHQMEKNVDAFVSASEELLQEWELEYIANKRLAERQA
jgi:hypothetical protein